MSTNRKTIKIAGYEIVAVHNPETLAIRISIFNSSGVDLTEVPVLPVLNGMGSARVHGPEIGVADGKVTYTSGSISYGTPLTLSAEDLDSRRENRDKIANAFADIAAAFAKPAERQALKNAFEFKEYSAVLQALDKMAHRLSAFADETMRAQVNCVRSLITANTARL